MAVSRAYFGKADQGIARGGSAGDGREAGDATKPLDQKLSERDMEAALTLSLLLGTDDSNVNLSPTIHTDQYPTMGLSPTTCEPPTHKGLDEIHAERGSSKHKSSPKTSGPPRSTSKDKDEDYKPKLTPESESEDNFSGVAESEDEEFTVRKVKKKSKKEKTKPPPPPASKREKQSSKREKQTAKHSKDKPPET
ncbi:hypothetical protein NHX12_020741, partial [Muraenolepis orangiensis]